MKKKIESCFEHFPCTASTILSTQSLVASHCFKVLQKIGDENSRFFRQNGDQLKENLQPLLRYWKKHIITTMIVMLELASSIVHFCKPSTGEVCNTAKMSCAFSSWPNSRKMPPSSSQLIIGEFIYYNFIFETKMLIEKLKAIWTLFKHVTVVTI